MLACCLASLEGSGRLSAARRATWTGKEVAVLLERGSEQEARNVLVVLEGGKRGNACCASSLRLWVGVAAKAAKGDAGGGMDKCRGGKPWVWVLPCGAAEGRGKSKLRAGGGGGSGAGAVEAGFTSGKHAAA
eukprot:1151572-Pelagomonas_calceolata.AAC.8